MLKEYNALKKYFSLFIPSKPKTANKDATLLEIAATPRYFEQATNQ